MELCDINYLANEKADIIDKCSVIHALKNKYSSYFTTMDDIMDITTKSRFGKFDEYDSFQDTVYSSEFLCIDDIGFSYKPARDEISYIDSLFFRLIRHRASNLLPILLTSQKSIIDLAGSSHSGDRTVSVLKGHVKKIQFTGKSYRDGLEKSIL